LDIFVGDGLLATPTGSVSFLINTGHEVWSALVILRTTAARLVGVWVVPSREFRAGLVPGVVLFHAYPLSLVAIRGLHGIRRVPGLCAPGLDHRIPVALGSVDGKSVCPWFFPIVYGVDLAYSCPLVDP